MNETFEQVLGYMTAHESGDAEEAFFDRAAWRELIARLRAAHEREVATLKAALKPVMECDVDFDPWSWMGDSLDNDQMNTVENMHNAVREAQRIAKEGGVA